MRHTFRTSLFAFAASLGLAASAAAQSMADLYPLAPETQVTVLETQAGQLKGLPVNGSEGAPVGLVAEALGTEGGTPTAVAVDFAGGAYGDRKGVIVPLADVQLGGGIVVLTVDPERTAEYPLYEPREPLPPGGVAE
ncbi:MAG TPA: PRC-barrel domain-containing protein [Mesorhizobium sp.]|jgi:hypothetical protein|nr:PRC-barrel domain-containing protein [Mesorhizobium sp.]